MRYSIFILIFFLVSCSNEKINSDKTNSVKNQFKYLFSEKVSFTINENWVKLSSKPNLFYAYQKTKNEGFKDFIPTFTIEKHTQIEAFDQFLNDAINSIKSLHTSFVITELKEYRVNYFDNSFIIKSEYSHKGIRLKTILGFLKRHDDSTCYVFTGTISMNKNEDYNSVLKQYENIILTANKK